jgi:16S rRNA (adenine1518-N6/adenine1519-N6)-dimethyltransferase
LEKMSSCIKARKSLGQHFLISDKYLGRIVSEAEVNSRDVVLEIGPGTGNLTEYLLAAAQKVVAVELDKRLAEYLKEKWAGVGLLTVLCEDALKCDWEKLAGQYLEPEGKFKLVANLPYYMATPLLLKLADMRRYFSLLAVMLQREVGDRLAASPGNKTYGYLTVVMQYYFKVERLFNVPAWAFRPRPKVDSVLIRLIPRESAAVSVSDEGLFFRLLEAAFNHRRKMLANALALGLGISAGEVFRALEELGRSPKLRPEQLSLEDFATLTDRLTRY